MIDRKKFDKLVKEYQNYFTNHKGENGESYWEEEEFKWRGIKTFQDNWDLDTQNLSDMIKRSLYGVSHMMVSQARFPEGMIEDFAEREPDTVRAMFKDLFDESKDIVERFHSFKQKSADLLERVGNGAKNHCLISLAAVSGQILCISVYASSESLDCPWQRPSHHKRSSG